MSKIFARSIYQIIKQESCAQLELLASFTHCSIDTRLF